MDASVSSGGDGSVDPQILSDVTDTVFPLPGATMRRVMRVFMFAASITNVACGGEPLPLDVTVERIDQTRFPDLELIAAEGLAPRDRAYEKLLVNRDGCVPDAQIPSYRDWFELTGPWNDDVAFSAEQSGSVVATKAGVADCFTSAGASIDPDDPINSFFGVADTAAYHAAGKEEAESISYRMGALYARCTQPYFEAMTAYLEPRRPAMIERNRELLEMAAREFAAAGYVP
jgi:hypothetical protein